MREVKDEYIKLCIKNHEALDAMVHGRATRFTLNCLVEAFNMAEMLCVMGIGEEYHDDIITGQVALRDMVKRGIAKGNRFLFTGSELKAVKLTMDIHDAQLEAATLGELQEALATIQKMQRQNKLHKIPVPKDFV